MDIQRISYAVMVVGLGWKDWSRSDIIYGIVVPIIVVLVIVGLSQLSSLFDMRSFGIVTGIISEIEEIVIIVGIPLLLGLVWNRWAGGASGFLLGSIYAMWWYVKYSPRAGAGAFSGMQLGGLGPTILGWVLSAMLIGYMAGALNKRSENFRRMLIAGVVATTVGGLLLFGLFQLSSSNVITGVEGFLLTVLTRTAAGVIIPIIAKVFMWYGETRFHA
ncbi:MAG TPA: hypothetical protein VGB11_04115 [Candidatus Bathyarchaeia archaeon]